MTSIANYSWMWISRGCRWRCFGAIFLTFLIEIYTTLIDYLKICHIHAIQSTIVCPMKMKFKFNMVIRKFMVLWLVITFTFLCTNYVVKASTALVFYDVAM